jgi:hypothetical protein
MRKMIIETDDWIVQKDEEDKEIIVTCFSDGHYVNDIHIPYEKLGIKK